MNDDILKGSLEHHERVDGNGYPNQLSHGQISKYGEIVGIIDVYGALTTDRSYHKAVDSILAAGIMEKEKGHFDPSLFSTFKNLIHNETIGK